MKPSNLAVLMASILLMAVGVGRAEETEYQIIGHKTILLAFSSATSNLVIMDSKGKLNTNGKYVIFKDTDFPMTISDFIESGKLCEFRGWHEWEVPSIFNRWAGTPCGEQDQSDSPGAIMMSYHQGQWCKFCHHCRHKIKVKKESEEWEP